MNETTVRGGCHCGKVAFEVTVKNAVTVQHCNCSMCFLLDYIHLIVPAERFCLISGEESLTEYTFNTGTARHLFCRICGIKSFYVPRSNPDGFSINLRCLELPPEIKVIEGQFDGKNWEQHADELQHLSKIDP